MSQIVKLDTTPGNTIKKSRKYFIGFPLIFHLADRKIFHLQILNQDSEAVHKSFSWSLNRKFYRGRPSSAKSRRRQTNGFPQDPNLRSWRPSKAVVITHGSPAHLRSGIKRENAISKKTNQCARFRTMWASQFKGIFGDNAARRAPIDLGSSPEVQEKSTPQNPPEKFGLPFSHFPLYFSKGGFWRKIASCWVTNVHKRRSCRPPWLARVLPIHSPCNFGLDWILTQH